MINTYKVLGMTCNGCKASVEDSLSQLVNVESVSVNLETEEAIISMSSPIQLKTLQNALSEKYQISEIQAQKEFDFASTQFAPEKSELGQLFPLFLIFGYIITTSILLNIQAWRTTEFMLDFMGLFYIVFSFFKLLDLKGFPESFRMYDPLAKVFPIYGWVYPFIEIALGLLFLFRLQTQLALIVTLVVLGLTTIGVTRALLSKKTVQCACLGTALKLPMTKATFIENSIMIVMAIIMLSKTIKL